jgi:cytochrome c-type biogenesis protein CcmF
VFWGTFFPLISEAVTGTKAAVGPPWFDRYTVPLALLLVLLSGIGPVIAWRRATVANLRRSFMWPVAAALVTLTALVAAGLTRNIGAVIMFMAGAFVLAVVAQELARGAAARRAMAGEAPPRALVNLVRRNRRRYGGYIVHLGMAVMFVGVAASSAFQHARDVQLSPGQRTSVGGYDIRYVEATSRISQRAGALEKISFGAVLDVRKDGRHLVTLRPEKGYYPSQDAQGLGAVGRFFEGESTSEVGMKAGLGRDLWTAMSPDVGKLRPIIDQGDKAFAAAEGKIPPAMESALLGRAIRGLVDRYQNRPPPATFRVISSPLVAWIWVGGLIVFTGGLIAMWPAADAAGRRVRAGYAARLARELGRA